LTVPTPSTTVAVSTMRVVMPSPRVAYQYQLGPVVAVDTRRRWALTASGAPAAGEANAAVGIDKT